MIFNLTSEGSFKVPYNEKANAWNVDFDDIVLSNSMRSYFKEELKYKKDTISQTESIISPKTPEYIALNNACKMSIGNSLRVLVVDEKDKLRIPLILKYNIKNKLTLFKDYTSRHMISSILKNCIMDSKGSLSEGMLRGMYLMYYYWFFRKDSIKEITSNVCVDMENMISLVMDKAQTLYRSYDTVSVVYKLREKLSSEKVILAGSI
jgi:hypothetical protein